MQIAPGVAMLEISAIIMGRPQTVCPTLFWDNQHVVLVDTGYPGQHLLIQQAMEQHGVTVQDLQTIILTHQDIDHIGSAPGLVSLASHPIEILCDPVEKPYIEGEQRLIKITPEVVERAVAALPREWPEERRVAFRRGLENPPHVHVDRTLSDGDKLPYCGGLLVIATPGHTPGHICLYHQSSRTLVAGDALTITGEGLNLAESTTSVDPDRATRSLNKLIGHTTARVICFHGGLFDRDPDARIAELAAKADLRARTT